MHKITQRESMQFVPLTKHCGIKSWKFKETYRKNMQKTNQNNISATDPHRKRLVDRWRKGRITLKINLVGKVALSVLFAFVNDDVFEYMILRCDSCGCNLKIFSQTLELLQFCVYYQCSTICISPACNMNSYTQELCLW